MALPLTRVFSSFVLSTIFISSAMGAKANDSMIDISRMPEGAWDSHIHIVDPSRYLLDASATYTPGIYTVWDNVIFETSIGAGHNTIIQPSIYGNDNTATLQALQAFGPNRARAVVVFDPAVTTAETLLEWHTLGVRGVRLNLGFESELPTVEDFKATLKSYADAVRPLGWAVQMYIPMDFLAQLQDYFPTLNVTIVFDHFGHPDLADDGDCKPINPYNIKGFGSLVNLLKNGRTWVKISAAYRLTESRNPIYPALDPLIKVLFKVAPERLVYASDWPHVLFEGLDIKPWTNHLLDLVGDDTVLRDRLFRDNARKLWDVE